jgi:hypothetical protein
VALLDGSSAACRTHRIAVIGEPLVEVGGRSTHELVGYLFVRATVHTVGDEL